MGEVSYKGHRYQAEIIAHCVWLYHRFPLSFREVGQAAGQAQVVGQHAGDHVARVPDHVVAADLDSNTFRPIRSSLHLIGALLDRFSNASER